MLRKVMAFMMLGVASAAAMTVPPGTFRAGLTADAVNRLVEEIRSLGNEAIVSYDSARKTYTVDVRPMNNEGGVSYTVGGE